MVDRRILLFLSCYLSANLAPAQSVNATVLKGLAWRSIGPAIMGGRISDLQGVPGDAATVFAAAGSGGLFRTTDGGMTWESLFDHQTTISIGSIAVQSDNPQVIWVGTGESNVRNSVSFGDGVYKSEDGGKTWLHMGLAETQTISRVIINPANPQNVFVAAVGHISGPNPERGVFVTQDGGHTWRKTLYIDDSHGASCLEMDPKNPDILYAGMWHFDRKPWTYTSGSEKGGLYKSQDGGQTWTKLTAGLPTLLGRIGIKVAPSAPNVVYAITESKEGTLYRSVDAGLTFKQMSNERELVGRAYYFTDLRVSPENENHIMVLADALLESKDGGAHVRRMSPSVHGDLHALWIDPKDPRRIWQGSDGGLAVTYDAGGHWEQINNIPLGQFYHVSADDRQPFYQVTAGMQDNGTWTGPSRTRELTGIFNDDWRMVNAMVGMNSMTDAEDPDVILTEQPGGALLLTNLKTREQQSVGPQPQSFGGAPASSMKYRFNWDAPLVRSPFGKNTIYLAGNVVFQSADYGKSWENISRDLTRDDKTRLGNVGGPVYIDNSASEVYSTITALAESPAKQGVIWAGTDDGNLQVTQNGGGEWTNLAAHFPGLAGGSPVSHVEPSRTQAATSYVSFDRHMFDDFHPYLFKTMDAGRSWTSLSYNLPPKAFIWTVREDPDKPGLLYVGTELGIYALWPGATEWLPLHGSNMPWSVAVRDIIFQPASGDIIVATHGRSLYVLDDASVLAQLGEAVNEKVVLLPAKPTTRFARRATRTAFGDKVFVGQNPEYGSLLTYYLKSEAQSAQIEILDEAKNSIVKLPVSTKAGLNRFTWDLRYSAPRSGRRVSRGPQVIPGNYTARLTADGISVDQPLTVRLDGEVKTTMDELKAQLDMCKKLLALQAEVGALQAKLRDASPSSPQIAELIARLARPATANRSEAPPGLRDNLDALFNMIDGVDAAPTAAQSHYFDELSSQYAQISAQAKSFF